MSICKQCDSEAATRGYCRAHYIRALRAGQIEKVSRSATCELPDCDKKRYSMDLCRPHYEKSLRACSPVRKLAKAVAVKKKKRVDVPMRPLVAASVKRALIKEVRRQRLEERGITPCVY